MARHSMLFMAWHSMLFMSWHSMLFMAWHSMLFMSWHSMLFMAWHSMLFMAWHSMLFMVWHSMLFMAWHSMLFMAWYSTLFMARYSMFFSVGFFVAFYVFGWSLLRQGVESTCFNLLNSFYHLLVIIVIILIQLSWLIGHYKPISALPCHITVHLSLAKGVYWEMCAVFVLSYWRKEKKNEKKSFCFVCFKTTTTFCVLFIWSLHTCLFI